MSTEYEGIKNPIIERDITNMVKELNKTRNDYSIGRVIYKRELEDSIARMLEYDHNVRARIAIVEDANKMTIFPLDKESGKRLRGEL